MSLICLDFDGTLHDPYTREAGYRMGKPVPGALDAVRELLADGHQLVVHTARAQADYQVPHVVAWLAFFGFPPLEVHVSKPMAELYIDDRALRFTGDWQETVDQAITRLT